MPALILFKSFLSFYSYLYNPKKLFLEHDAYVAAKTQNKANFFTDL